MQAWWPLVLLVLLATGQALMMEDAEGEVVPACDGPDPGPVETPVQH